MSQDNWELTAEQFEAFVCEHENRLAIVHFWAQWNPLDRSMHRVVRDVNEAVGTQIAFSKVEVGPLVNQDLCRWIGISQVPTLIFVFRHRIVDVKIGYSKNRLVNHVQVLMQNFNRYTPPLPPPTYMPPTGPFGPQTNGGMPPGQFSVGNGANSMSAPPANFPANYPANYQGRPAIEESQLQGTQLGPRDTLNPNYFQQSDTGWAGNRVHNRGLHPMMKYGLYPFQPPQTATTPPTGKKSWFGRLFGEF